MKALNLLGQKFGRWTVLSVTENHGAKRCFLCRCDCGTERSVMAGNLTGGASKSCGCLDREKAKARFLRHGQGGTRLNNIWNSMKGRCNPKYGQPQYAGRGISVCSEWSTFEPFYDWAMANGYDDAKSIDRIDNNGNYCPENCRWVPWQTQAENKRNVRMFDYNGERLSARALSLRLGYNFRYISAMLRKGKQFLGVADGKIIWGG